MQILAWKDKMIRNKELPLIEILCRKYKVEKQPENEGRKREQSLQSCSNFLGQKFDKLGRM